MMGSLKSTVAGAHRALSGMYCSRCWGIDGRAKPSGYPPFETFQSQSLQIEYHRRNTFMSLRLLADLLALASHRNHAAIQ